MIMGGSVDQISNTSLVCIQNWDGEVEVTFRRRILFGIARGEFHQGLMMLQKEGFKTKIMRINWDQLP